MRRLIIFLLICPLFLFSCLTLQGELLVNSADSYQLTLNYSVNKDFASIKYLASNAAVLPLPLNEDEWLAFASKYPGVEFLPSYFQSSERGERILLQVRLLLNDPEILEDLLSCRVIGEENPDRLTLEFNRGAGEPSEEAVAFINGYCAGEEISFEISGPGGAESSGNWPLRELLLADEAPRITIEWEEP